MSATALHLTTALTGFEPAVRLGNEHAGQPHFGELRPKVAREAGSIGGIA